MLDRGSETMVKKEVQWFAEKMEKKLKENDHKEHWRKLHKDYLLHRLFQEANKLWRAIQVDKTPEEIIEKCADVANCAMMIADNYGQRESKKIYARRGTGNL